MKDRMNGYLTIFLSLSLSLLLSLFFVLIRGAFINYSKMKLEIVTDIGMNSVLAEYHRELLNQYDLLLIDMSYGTSSGGIHKLENHLIGYIGQNLQTTKNSVSAWNTLALQDVQITETLMPHYYDGKILKRQACEYMSEKIRAEAIEDLSSYLTQAESLDRTDEMASWQNVMGKITSILSALTTEARQQALSADSEAEVDDINVSVDNPADDIYSNANQQINNLTNSDKKGESITLSNYFSHRSSNQFVPPSGKYETNIINNIASSLLFRTYLLEKMGYYQNEKEGSLLNYQIEYLIVGANADDKNLRGIKTRIFAWRLADNVRLYFSDSKKRQEANAIAATVSALIMHPELTQLIANSLLFSWAFSTSLDDVKALLDGNQVPLVKKSINQKEGGLLYSQYLEIMILITDESKILARVMDVIEMDIRLTPNNQNFRIDLCLESFRASIDYHDQYGVYNIDRRYGY